MLYLKKPTFFNSQFDVVSSLLHSNKKFLFLRRNPGDNFGNLWGAPTGKRKNGETLGQALKREVFEETGIYIDIKKASLFQTFYVHHGELYFTYYLYYYKLTQTPKIRLQPDEHIEYGWFTIKEALELPLVPDMKECLKLFLKEYHETLL